MDKSESNRDVVIGTGRKLECPWREKLMPVTPTRGRRRGTMFQHCDTVNRCLSSRKVVRGLLLATSKSSVETVEIVYNWDG